MVTQENGHQARKDGKMLVRAHSVTMALDKKAGGPMVSTPG